MAEISLHSLHCSDFIVKIFTAEPSLFQCETSRKLQELAGIPRPTGGKTRKILARKRSIYIYIGAIILCK